LLITFYIKTQKSSEPTSETRSAESLKKYYFFGVKLTIILEANDKATLLFLRQRVLASLTIFICLNTLSELLEITLAFFLFFLTQSGPELFSGTQSADIVRFCFNMATLLFLLK